MEWLIVTIPAVFLLWVVSVFNRLVKFRNQVNEAWAGIDVQLQKRHELVPNLVATVRAYAGHEASVLEEVVRQRGGINGSVSDKGSAETALSESLSGLFALAEDYPELKADEGFRQLHSSLVEIEDHLQFARRYYNGSVRDNNNFIESFPSNLVAKTFGFRGAEFFEIALSANRASPDVDV